MRNVRPGGPDYRLCDQTVTLYRASFGQGGAFSCRKWVLPRAFLDITATEKLNAGEYRQERSFLLVVPLGEGMELPSPGDRVLRGEGEAVTSPAQWDALCEGGAVTLEWVRQCFWGTEPCHVEAGG